MTITLKDLTKYHQNKHINIHKINYLDVLVELKRKTKIDYIRKGKIYNTNIIKHRFHPLYVYFQYKDHYFQWTNKPVWFAENLKTSIDYFLQCKYSYAYKESKEHRMEISKAIHCIIDNWLNKPESNNSDNTNYWRIQRLKLNLQYDAFFHKSLGKCYNHSRFTEVYPENIEDDSLRQQFYRDKQEFNMYKIIKRDFESYKTVQKSKELFDDVYTLKLSRQWDGLKMDYKESYKGKYDITCWKKTLTNGKSSNKGLTATYLYLVDPNFIRIYNQNRKIWNFSEGVVLQYQAEKCVLSNGFPAWGKKTGRKKPTYKEMKLWWYKI